MYGTPRPFARASGTIALGLALALSEQPLRVASRAGKAPDASVARPVAFVGVTVVPMDRERLLRDQTVVVAGDRITAVGARRSISTAGAMTIDARGKYLTPGLVDAHTHMLLTGDLILYVVNGVTTAFDLGSFDESGLMALRDSVRRALLVGPTLYLSYFVDGPQTANGRRVITTPEAARSAVADAKRSGFEFIKAYNSIPESAAVALLDASRTQHIAVIGHGIRSLGLERGLALGQAAVAHAEEYFYAAVRNVRDTSEWRRAAAFTKASGAYVIPNLSAYDVIERQWGRRPVLDSILHVPETRYLGELWRREWGRGAYTSRAGTLDGRTRILRAFTKMLIDSGVPIMVGTDSPTIPGIFPGWSAHLDMRELVDAGATRYQALSAGTRVPGEFVARYVPGAERFGVVAPGYRADLLLVDGNPLEDLRHLTHPDGVMVRGRWLPRSALDSLLATDSRSAPGGRGGPR